MWLGHLILFWGMLERLSYYFSKRKDHWPYPSKPELNWELDKFSPEFRERINNGSASEEEFDEYLDHKEQRQSDAGIYKDTYNVKCFGIDALFILLMIIGIGVALLFWNVIDTAAKVEANEVRIAEQNDQILTQASEILSLTTKIGKLEAEKITLGAKATAAAEQVVETTQQLAELESDCAHRCSWWVTLGQVLEQTAYIAKGLL